jgi:hypothetical protein
MDTIDLTTVYLDSGDHETRERGLCAMEAVAWLAGEPHSAEPACTCPMIAAYVQEINDRMPDDARQRLVAYLPRLVGTWSTPAVARARMFVAVDDAVRVHAPLALDARGLREQASRLRALAPIVDLASAQRAAAAYAANAAARAATPPGSWDSAIATLDHMLAVTTVPQARRT